MVEPRLRIRIDRKYRGDMNAYYVSFTYGSRICEVRQAISDNIRVGMVAEDNLHILLNIPFKISGIKGDKQKLINSLKVPPKYKSHVRENVLSL